MKNKKPVEKETWVCTKPRCQYRIVFDTDLIFKPSRCAKCGHPLRKVLNDHVEA